jgi:hypothetical protein
VWIQRIAACENGQTAAIVERAHQAGLGHVMIRLSDGGDAANVRPDGADLAATLCAGLTKAGIAVWGWAGLYGDPPSHQRAAADLPYHLHEAEMAVRRTRALLPAGLVGLVLDARVEYERCAKPETFAEAAAARLRDQLPDLPLGLSSWKSPTEHPNFPWYAFRRFVDLDLPHIFWLGQPAEAARQMTLTTQAYAALSPRRLLGAVGSALWLPQPAELVEFLTQARALGLAGAGIWRWDELGLRGNEAHNRQGLDLHRLWEAVAQFPWPVDVSALASAQPRAEASAPLEPMSDLPPTLKRFFVLLRRGQWAELVALYAADVAQLVAREASYGRDSLVEVLPRARAGDDFGSLAVLGVNALAGHSGPDPGASIYTVRWVLDAGRPDARAGSDTFHLNRRGEIVFHATALLGS